MRGERMLRTHNERIARAGAMTSAASHLLVGQAAYAATHTLQEQWLSRIVRPALRAHNFNRFIMLAGYWCLTKAFGGMVLGVLPFHMPTPFKYLTHRGLDGDDFRQVSLVSQTLSVVTGWAA
jgi:hypothetical protein